MSDENKIPKWITVVASVTTLLVPFFYIFGYAYDQGYLRTYGVSNEFFSRSIQEYLVFAFLAFLEIARSILEFSTKHPWLFIWLALLFGVVALVFVILHKCRVGQRLDPKAEAIKAHKLFDYLFFPFMAAAFALCAPYLVITVLSIVLILPSIAYLKGQNIAEKEIATASSCAYVDKLKEGCVYLIDNGKRTASGQLVARNATHLALFDQGKTTIYPVKDQLVEVVAVVKKPAVAAKSYAH